jgi:hypothetical protein
VELPAAFMIFMTSASGPLLTSLGLEWTQWHPSSDVNNDGRVVATSSEAEAQLQCCLVTLEGSCTDVLLF